jgi:hypothetical protein
LLHISNRESVGYLRDEDIINISCQDLREIDQLWSQYSNGKFGYTAQKKIWKRVGVDWVEKYNLTPNDPVFSGYYTGQGFPSEVGWLVSDSSYEVSGRSFVMPTAACFRHLKFNINAPTGHLPTHIRSIDMEYDKSYGYRRLKNPKGVDDVYVCYYRAGENHSHFSKALTIKMDSCRF